MADVAQILADPSLYPRQTGQPRGVVPIPTPDQPEVSPQATQVVGAALRQLGGNLETLGQAVTLGQEVEARRQKAQDVVDANLRLNPFTQDRKSVV